MSVLLPVAALRVYDSLKQRPGANPRKSDARDASLLADIERRMQELIATYKITSVDERGHTFVYWAEIIHRVNEGVFDDLLDRL
jgi:hypothetical protein